MTLMTPFNLCQPHFSFCVQLPSKSFHVHEVAEGNACKLYFDLAISSDGILTDGRDIFKSVEH